MTLHHDDRQCSRERRLCFLHAGSAPDALNEAAERFRESSDFTARMMEWAESIGQRGGVSVDVSYFTNDAFWRSAWDLNTLYARGASSRDIINPTSFLENLPPEDRKEILLQYLRERYPDTISRRSIEFQDIVVTPAVDLGDPKHMRSIRTFTAVGEEMDGFDASALANGAQTAFATVPELKRQLQWELERRYRRGSGITGRAYLDFVKAVKQDPLIAQSVIANPASLQSYLYGVRTPFATAVRDGMFSADHLKNMAEQYRTATIEKERALRDSSAEQQKIKNRIEVVEKRNFVEKLMDGFRDLETWKKWAVVIGGAALISLVWRAKYPRIFKRPLQAATILAGFYFFGGREMIRGTALEGVFAAVEKPVGEVFKGFRDKLGMVPELSEDELRTYVEFVREIATEELKGQVEAMGYISQVPIGAIADSFTLADGARTGTLSLQSDSPLSRAIKEKFESTIQHGRILNRLRSNADDLSDVMAHAFFSLGAISYPDDFHAVEELRADRPYDDIPDGTLGRRTYEWLAQQGMKIAKSQYTGKSWLEVITKIIETVPPASTYPPGSPSVGGLSRSHPPSSPGTGTMRPYPPTSPGTGTMRPYPPGSPGTP